MKAPKQDDNRRRFFIGEKHGNNITVDPIDKNGFIYILIEREDDASCSDYSMTKDEAKQLIEFLQKQIGE